MLDNPRHRVMRRLSCFLVYAWAVAIVSSSTASAQEATALDRFQPAVAGDRFLSVPAASVEGRVKPAFGVVASYASSPLVLVDARGEVVRSVVEHQVTLHALTSIALFDRVLFHVDLPATLLLDGEGIATEPGTRSFAQASGASLQDLRFGGRVELVEQAGWIPSASVGAWVFAPTGDETSYAGTGDWRASPHLIVGASWDPIEWTASLGRTLASSSLDRAPLFDNLVTVGLGAAVKIDRFAFGLEATTSLDAGNVQNGSASTRVHAELLATAKAHVGPVRFDLGAGPGLARAPGTPKVRVIAGISVELETLPARADEPGTTDAPFGGAGSDIPSVGVALSSEPSVAGTSRAPGSERGPVATATTPDVDGDLLSDARDACPSVPGPVRGDPFRDGCPVDTDGDGVPDDRDACVKEPGVAAAEAGRNGCPLAVSVTVDRITILEPIRFETNRAVLLPESTKTLREIAAVLQKDESIARVAIDGHTDGRGAARSNLELSRARAVAVMRWLNGHGIDPRRTEARGFGARVPIADNETEAGRAKNRRVELVILRRTDQGRSGWVEGTLVEPGEEP